MKNYNTQARLMCCFLNNLLQTDPVAISELFDFRTLCNNTLAEHPDVQVKELAGGSKVGFLEILNGFFGINSNNELGYIIAIYDTKNQKLLRFQFNNA